MQSNISIAFIILAIGGLLGQQVQEFCYDHYCYRTDGELKNVTSLKDAQDYCTNNDSASWLLEMYGYNQYMSLRNGNYLRGFVVLNSIGTVANEWTSVFNGQLPSGLSIDESLGQDFLYLSVSGGQLYFKGAGKSTWGFTICRVLGNCSDGNCFETIKSKSTWFTGESGCFTNKGKVDKDYGHLATFEGMTYDEISNLSFVSQLTENTVYWIGYSKLVYTLQHSNVRNYVLLFSIRYPLLTTSHPNESYFVYLENSNFKEKPFGDEKFQIICMTDTTATTRHTSTPATPTSVPSATVVNSASSTTATHWNSFETNPTTAILKASNDSKDTTATTRHTSTPATPTSASSATATHWNSFETNSTTAGLKASNDSKVNFSESTIILSLLLPILLWLVFSISFICCILPFCVNRNTRRDATIP